MRIIVFVVYRFYFYRGIAQLVEHWSPKPSAEGSSPSAPATSERTLLRSDFCLHKNQSHAPSMLLYRKYRHARRACLLVNALAAARYRHHIFASVPAAKIPKLFSLPITNDTISNKNNHPRGRLFLFESLYLRAFIGFTLTHTRRPKRTTGVSEGV